MELTLKEKYVVIAYHPDKGTRLAASFMSFGIAGAILMELAELEKIGVKNKRIKLLSTQKTGDQVLDRVIDLLRNSNKPIRIKSLISKIAHKPSKFKNPILEGLIEKKIMKKERKRFLIFPYNRYPALKKDYRNKLVDRMRNLILKNSEVENDIVMLAGLSGSSQFINKFFHTSYERKTAKKRVKDIIESSQIDKAIVETVRAVQAAVLVTVTTTAAVSASR